MTLYFFEIHSNIVLPLCQVLPSGIFPVGLLIKILKALLPSFIFTTCPAHPCILDLIILAILGKPPHWPRVSLSGY